MITLEEIRAARLRDEIAQARAADQPGSRPSASPSSSLAPAQMRQPSSDQRTIISAMTPAQPTQIERAIATAQPTGLGRRVAENIIGDDDDSTDNLGERVANLLNIAGEAMTLGVVGDEASARFDQMLGRGSYDDRLQVRRDQEARTRDRNPALSFGADMAGASVLPGGVALRFVRRGVGRAAQALRSGAVAGVAGGIFGFNEGEGTAQDRLLNAVQTGGLSAAFGFVAPSILEGVSGVPRRIQALWRGASQRPTVEALRGLKSAAYTAVENAGVRFSGDDMTALSQRVRAAFEADNYVDDVDDASRATLLLLERRAGQDTTLNQLDRIRQNLWRRYTRASDQPRILDAISQIDDLVATAAEGSALMQVARAANARFSKSQLLENAFERVQDMTATAGSGGNIVNNSRRAVSAIINDPRRARFFSQPEIDVMRGFVRGSTGENLQRLIGKLSPTGNGLMGALHIVGGLASSGATVPLMAVGAGMKAAADRGVRRGAERLMDMTSGFIEPSRAGLPGYGTPAITAGVGSGVASANEASQRLDSMRRRGQ